MMRPTAVILAAGKGTRMGCLGEGKAKAMINLHGRPLIAHVLQTLEGVVDDAVIVVGHRQEDVRQMGDKYHGIKLHYAVQPQPVGTTDATLRAQPFIKTPSYMLMFCDVLFPPIYVQQCASCADSCVYAWLKDPTNCGICTIGNGGNVLDIWEKPPKDQWLQFDDHGEYPCYVGLVHLRTGSFKTLRETLNKSLAESKESSVPDAIGTYATAHALHGWPMGKPPRMVGTLKELEDAYGNFVISKEFNRSYLGHSNLDDDDMYDEFGWRNGEWITQIPITPRWRPPEYQEVSKLLQFFNLPEEWREIAPSLPPWILDNPYAMTAYVMERGIKAAQNHDVPEGQAVLSGKGGAR